MSRGFRDGPVTVRAPATSANLGPGFDTLGLALGIHDQVSAEVVDHGLSIDVEGEGAGDVPGDESHLVIRAMRAAFDQLGAQPPGLRVTCANRIPHGRGLGSSAAAIVCGVVLANSLTSGRALEPAQELELAAALEGHPDNVAACLLGGLTIAWSDSDARAHATRVEPKGVAPVVFIPAVTSSTNAARQALPETVAHTDAVFNAARSALLVTALTTGATSSLWDATDDRLHQSYRAAGMPASSELMTRLRDAGLAAAISGAGPTVLVLSRSQSEVETALQVAGDAWKSASPGFDLTGARVL